MWIKHFFFCFELNCDVCVKSVWSLCEAQTAALASDLVFVVCNRGFGGILIMATRFHGGGTEVEEVAFHPRLQKNERKTHTKDSLWRQNNNRRDYLVCVEIHLQGLNTHRFLTQQRNRNIYSERAEDGGIRALLSLCQQPNCWNTSGQTFLNHGRKTQFLPDHL